MAREREMEACGSAHYWARRPSALGHEVEVMASQLVKPKVKSNKNGGNLAAAALADKNARILWALLAPGREYRQDHAPTRPSGPRQAQALYRFDRTEQERSRPTQDCSGTSERDGKTGQTDIMRT